MVNSPDLVAGSKTTAFLVSHEFSRTGAPLALLALARELRSNGLDVRIVGLRGGAIHSVFAAEFPTQTLHPLLLYGLRSRLRPVPKPLRRLCRATATLLGRRVFKAADIMVLNSLASMWALPLAHNPILVWAHELQGAADRLGVKRPGPETAKITWAVVSQEVGAVVDARLRRPGERLIYAPPPMFREDLLELDLYPRRSNIVLGLGVASRTKGIDLFVQVAAKVNDIRPGLATFVWAGDGPELVGAKSDASLARAPVEFVGAVPDPSHLLARADLLALTSREDSFPLVMLEAAAAGCPCIGFRGTGGVDDLSGLGAAVTVAPLDAAAMAEEVVRLLENDDERLALAIRGRDVVRERYLPAQSLRDLVAEVVRLAGA